MEMSMHDNWLLSYCVSAEKHEIIFHTYYPDPAHPETADIDEIAPESINTDYEEMFVNG